MKIEGCTTGKLPAHTMHATRTRADRQEDSQCGRGPLANNPDLDGLIY